MAFTPVEIRHVKFGRGVAGYRRDAVNKTLEEIAISFEDVWRERADLADRVEQLETEIGRLREREDLLKETLIAAERNAVEVKETAQKHAELLVSEAHAEARAITRGAHSERERLIAEARRVRALLRSALDVVEESQASPAEAPDEASDPKKAEHWPRRDDTREFESPAPQGLGSTGAPGHIRSA
jgi:cell division septum initiation protein DivIVA